MKDLFSLNGDWYIDYFCDQPYMGIEEPQMCMESESVTVCKVPGYWEDMTELFRSTALHTKLHWNPLYTLQRYPQAGYVPDMALPNPVGCFVYQKIVSLEESVIESFMTDDSIIEKSSAGNVVLSFGGVQNTVSAWINGQYLGRHQGYSTPFSFVVPKGILRSGKNRITLAVSNNRLVGYQGRPVSGLTSRAANECTGGIYGNVELRIYPDGLKDVWVSTAKDGSFFTVHTIGAKDKNKKLQIYDETKLIYETEISMGEDTSEIATTNYEFWSPDFPKLYRVVISTEHQEISANFGIRRLTVEGTKLYLNGEPYFFRGSCEHCYQPITVHPTQEKNYYRMVIRKLKELGFNSIRFHTWVPPQEYMEAADELGMLMEIESPNNTSAKEWEEIVRFCRHHAAVNMYSTGNELQIDADYEKHLKYCADLVHRETDALFSPMSAMRGIEYHFVDDEYVTEPFMYNPRRLAEAGSFSDVYNSYSLGLTSYDSASGTQAVLDERNKVYEKPLLSHEICIHGTYIDLSLEERYRGTRIGDTEFMSSVRKHLKEKGLLDRANLYYRNSAAWQRMLRKHCFETLRRCDTFAGYDFLGDIDTHWHTFGYCVGMMNEFYELKPGETIENVLRYNSDTVLLADFPKGVNFVAGENVEIPLLVSHYGKEMQNAFLQIRINHAGKVLFRKQLQLGEIPRGAITELYRLSFDMPSCKKMMHLKLTITLSGGDTDCENMWDMYVYPKVEEGLEPELYDKEIVIRTDCDKKELLDWMQQGKKVVLFGCGPFPSREVSWQLSVAGRTNGHLATVIADHPLMEEFLQEGYCGHQFVQMMNESASIVLDKVDMPHHPIVDIASSYKNAHREAMLFEYCVGSGKLLVCTFRLQKTDPAAEWLKKQILTYVKSEKFNPAQTLSIQQLEAWCQSSYVRLEKNCNEAMNKNDITM